LRLEPLCRPVIDWRGVLFVGVGAEQASVNSEAVISNQILDNAALDNPLSPSTADQCEPITKAKVILTAPDGPIDPFRQ